jgi:two-component system, OmpR family, sensor kinase
MTLRTKLVLWYSGLLAIIIVIFAVAVFSVMRYTLINTVDRTLEETVRQVIQNSRTFPVADFSGPERVIVTLPPLDVFSASGVLIQVWTEQEGSPHLEDASANLSSYDRPLNQRALGSSDADYSNIVINDDTTLRVLTSPMVTVQGKLIGNVQVASSLNTVNQATDRLLGIMLVSGGVGILGSIAVGMLLSSRATRPIERITQAAGSIAVAKDLKTRLPWDGPMDELGRLTVVFNQMMERLEQAFGIQQRFVADVSHELRTPLTAIRGNLDLIKRYGMDDMSLEAITDEVDRMSRMVNDLLMLARADYGGLTLDLGPTDLDTIVSDVYREARVLAKDRDLRVVMERFEPVRIHGNPDRMKQVVLNLVSNAIKFTPDGGKVSLSLYQTSDDAVIEVKDTGIGISKADQVHIFDRFFQADASRSRHGEGTGLGLSIAKWIVEAHNGALTVESDLGKGSAFIVTLPLQAVETPEAEMPRVSALRSRLNTARNWLFER